LDRIVLSVSRAPPSAASVKPAARVQQLIDGVLVVGVAKVAVAERLLGERNRVIAEGAGAFPVACGPSGQAGAGRIVCVVSGGNIDAAKLCAICAKYWRDARCLAKVGLRRIGEGIRAWCRAVMPNHRGLGRKCRQAGAVVPDLEQAHDWPELTDRDASLDI
jgi:hypothetical protein